MPLALAHAAATLVLVGLIWTVQVVHYPLMSRVGADGYVGFQVAHERRITLLVGPLMVAEAVLAAALVVAPPAGVPRSLALAGAALVAAIWAVTNLVSVPCHARLRRGFDAAAHARLVRTNWLRTAAWTARGALAIAIVAAVA